MGGQRKKRVFNSVRNKIIFLIYLVMFPVLIVVGVFMFVRSTQAVTAENTRTYQTSVEVLSDSLGYFEQDLLDIFTYIVVNKDVEGVLRAPRSLGREDPLFWNSLSPMSFVKDMLNVKGNIRAFILYPENGLVPYYSSQDGSIMEKDIAVVRREELYRRAVDARGDTVWEPVSAGAGGLFIKNESDKIVLAKEIFDASKQKRLGFMALSVDVRQYEQMCRVSLLYPDDGIVILDGNYGEIARAGAVDDAALAYIRSRGIRETVTLGGQKPAAVEGTYIFAAPRSKDGWVFYLSPKASWDAKIHAGLLLPLSLGLALLVCILPISLMASRIISQPLLRLYRSMERFKDGDFSQRVAVEGQDEIASLSESFNHMVQDMKEMIDRNYIMVLREKESELNALQAQINPHFLYNALDSLYWQAVDNGQDALAENILSLSSLFRVLLSAGKSEITVRQEISLVTHYLEIQKMRFGKKLDYSISIPEEMMEYSISKLLLQPFVENAIVHGLERLDSWGCVQVRGEAAEGRLHFVIEDNGAGMTPEKLEEILHGNRHDRYANQRVGHFAVHNVKERMRLRYGARAELEIQSQPDRGTRVSILLPAEKPGAPQEPPQ